LIRKIWRSGKENKNLKYKENFVIINVVGKKNIVKVPLTKKQSTVRGVIK